MPNNRSGNSSSSHHKSSSSNRPQSTNDSAASSSRANPTNDYSPYPSNPASGQTASSYPQGPSAYPSAYPQQEQNPTGSTNSGLAETPAQEGNMNPKGYRTLDTGWEEEFAKGFAHRGDGGPFANNEILPFWTKGWLIPSSYEVPARFLEKTDNRVNWARPELWRMYGLRMQNFTKHFPELLWKWYFSAAVNPEFRSCWGRYFGEQASCPDANTMGQKWVDKMKKWAKKNPKGLVPVKNIYDSRRFKLIEASK